MRKIEADEIQKYLLGIVTAFDEFARENGITYYLSGGTLIGAVRHSGFIPWDDDIDIMMPRKDYDKLLATFTHDIYKLADCDSNEKYGSSYARMWDSRTKRDWGNLNNIDMGVYIDIMPMDGYPNSLLLSKIRECRLMLLRRLRASALKKEVPKNAKLRSLKVLYKKLNHKTANDYARKINRIGRKNDFDTSEYVGVQSATHNTFKERNPRSIFDNTVYFKFENLMLPAPEGYDVYLRHIFGDYMQLPPEEQRVRRHAQDIYVIDEQEEMSE